MKIVNKSDNPLPKYETTGSIGMDLRSNVEQVIRSGEWEVISTGLYIELPVGLEAQIRPRSGLAAKKGITVLNSPGTIDYDYRGEIGIILINHGEGVQIIHKGDRIAQMVINPITKVTLEEVKSLNETDRGKDGFGSTGIQ